VSPYHVRCGSIPRLIAEQPRKGIGAKKNQLKQWYGKLSCPCKRVPAKRRRASRSDGPIQANQNNTRTRQRDWRELARSDTPRAPAEPKLPEKQRQYRHALTQKSQNGTSMSIKLEAEANWRHAEARRNRAARKSLPSPPAWPKSKPGNRRKFLKQNSTPLLPCPLPVMCPPTFAAEKQNAWGSSEPVGRQERSLRSFNRADRDHFHLRPDKHMLAEAVEIASQRQSQKSSPARTKITARCLRRGPHHRARRSPDHGTLCTHRRAGSARMSIARTDQQRRA